MNSFTRGALLELAQVNTPPVPLRLNRDKILQYQHADYRLLLLADPSVSRVRGACVGYDFPLRVSTQPEGKSHTS